jgi:hypothetical protein
MDTRNYRSGSTHLTAKEREAGNLSRFSANNQGIGQREYRSPAAALLLKSMIIRSSQPVEEIERLGGDQAHTGASGGRQV